MRSDKEFIFKLRKEGLSYREIQRRVPISKGTLYAWLGEQSWSENIKASLTIKAIDQSRKRLLKFGIKSKKLRETHYAQKRAFANESFKVLRSESLFLNGLMLYWGEGDNYLQNGQIRITNSDPMVLRLFHLFIQQYLPELVNKIKMYLVLYPDLNEDRCKNFWSKHVGVSKFNFYRSQFIIGKSKKRTLPYGVGTLKITSRADKEIIIKWIKLIREEISNMRV